MTTKLNLTDFLNTNRHPHSATIPLGGGDKLPVTYRANDAERAQAAILGAVGDDLTALGFEPRVTLAAAAGRVPAGEDGKRLKEAVDALDADGFARFQAVMKRAEGAAIADVLGSWGFEDAITPESCASLPDDLQRTLLALSGAAVLPAERLDFLGK